MAKASVDTNKEKALKNAFDQIRDRFGSGSIMLLGDKGDINTGVKVTSTGSISIDAALGVGGFPHGRVVEIFGPESSGKTTLAIHAMAQAQKNGGAVAFIDAEHAFDSTYAANLGINLDELLISQPDHGEQALEIAETLVRSNAIEIVVIDSVAALVPKSEVEGDMGEAQMGLQARLMSQALRKLTGIIYKSRTCIIFINQMRQKIGHFYGSPETTTGGNALKFYASMRIDIRRIGALKEQTDLVGNRTRVKVVKNKLSPPFKEAEVDIMFGQGISREGELIDLGVENKLVQKSGAWFSYDKDRIGQGRENAKKFLKENPKIALKLENEIREALGINPVAGDLEPTEEIKSK